MMDRRPTRIGLGGALASILLALARPAGAQDDAAKLREEGNKLLAEGKTAEACAKLEESHKAAPKSETLLDLAGCHEKENKTATAVAEYKEAANLARKEKRYDREKTAKLRVLVLEPKLPRLTVTVAAEPSGLEVSFDGAALAKPQWGKPRAVDPGEHLLSARAPGKKAWESKVTLAAAEKKTVAVPALADDAAGAAAAPAAAAAAPAKPGAKPAPASKDAPPAAAASTAAPPPEAPAGKREAGRPVVEIGPMAAGLFADFDTAPLDGIQGLLYQVKVRPLGTVQNVECGPDNCDAHFESALGLLVGGQLFVGYAFTPGFHFGGRGFGALRIKGGWMLVGGPAASIEVVDNVWIGASFLVGAVRQTATVSEIRGAVPKDVQDLNGGEQVVVPPAPETPTEAEVGSEFAFGGNLELAYAITSFSVGSIMVGGWPMFLKGTNGIAIALPVGFAFKFH